MSRACTLYRKGLRYFKNIWDPGKHDVLNWETTKVKFLAEEVYQELWLKLIEFYSSFRDRMLNEQNAQLIS